MVVEKTDLMCAEVIHDPANFLGIVAGRVQEPGHETHLRSGAMVLFDAQLAPATQRFGGHEQLDRAGRTPNRGSIAR